jgi:YHS domain-containing protein
LCFFIFSNTSSFSGTSSWQSDSAVCIVSGEKIEDGGFTLNYLGENIKFCCQGCEKSFKRNPAKYLAAGELKCPVCDERDAKKEISLESGGVKYYFCGKGCKENFEKDPQEYLKRYKSKDHE